MKPMGALLTSLALSACSTDKTESAGQYAQIEVPVNVLSSDDARQRGRLLFQDKCALCHGARADGQGVRSKGLSGKPADFSSPTWRAGATPRYVYQVISEGKRGTSMPAWPTLGEQEKWDVVAYVLSIAEDGP